MSTSDLAIGRDGNEVYDVLDVRGELDLTNAAALQEELTRTRQRTVVLDLSLLVFVDSAGIRAIDGANRRLRAEGRTLLVVAPPGSRAAWTFRIAGFDQGVVLDSLEAATRRAEPALES
jgi:anti-anti-sigma factor